MSASKQIINKHEQMFYPTVRVRTNKSRGSGTVVYSKKHDGEAYTYVVTNHHVVDNCIKIVKKWNPIKKKKIDTEILDTVQVEYFRYNNFVISLNEF